MLTIHMSFVCESVLPYLEKVIKREDLWYLYQIYRFIFSTLSQIFIKNQSRDIFNQSYEDLPI